MKNEKQNKIKVCYSISQKTKEQIAWIALKYMKNNINKCNSHILEDAVALLFKQEMGKL